MNVNFIYKIITAFICSLVKLAIAAEDTDSSTIDNIPSNGFYLGLGIGPTQINDKQIEDELKSALNASVDSEIQGDMFKLLLGYRFNRIINIEFQATDYGNSKYRYYIEETDSFNTALTIKAQALSLRTNIGYTFSTSLRPHLSLGVSLIANEIEDKINKNDDREGNNAVHYGLGVEYIPTDFPLSFVVAYQIEHFETEVFDESFDAKIKSLHMGFNWYHQ